MGLSYRCCIILDLIIINLFNCSSDILYIAVKKEHIKKLKEKSITYDCTPAVINDFDHTLNRADNKRHENSDILSVIKLLTNSIKSGNELDDDTIFNRKVILKLVQNHKEYLTIVYDLRY